MDQLKKLGKADRESQIPAAEASKKEDDKEITLDTIVLAGIERGLTVEAIKKMQLGQVVDFCISYNERQKEGEKAAERKKSAKHYRLATPQEITSYTRS